MHLTIPATIVLLASAVAVGHHQLSEPADDPTIGITLTDVELPDRTLGCDVTLTATNSGSQSIKFKSASQVRAKPKISPSYGTWKKLWTSDQTMAAGRSWSRVVRLTFGCNYQRQYRFTVTYGGNEHAFTYPSNGGTNSTTISMGNLYTKFFD